MSYVGRSAIECVSEIAPLLKLQYTSSSRYLPLVRFRKTNIIAFFARGIAAVPQNPAGGVAPSPPTPFASPLPSPPLVFASPPPTALPPSIAGAPSTPPAPSSPASGAVKDGGPALEAEVAHPPAISAVARQAAGFLMALSCPSDT